MIRCKTLALTCLLTLASHLLFAQNPMKLDPVEGDVWDHKIGPNEAIHVSDKTLHIWPRRVSHNAITLIAVVGPDGRVTKAHAVDGEKELFPQAEQIERARIFKPFTHKGHVVSAEIIDYVSVVGPEEWLFWHVPFPATVDIRTVTMSLSRTACFGRCPAYTVSITGSGLVTFNGQAFVLLPGHHTAQVPVAAVRALFDAFRKAEFLSAKDDYFLAVTDIPTYEITLTMGGVTKQVTDRMGTEVGLPDAVEDLERQIDQTAGTERWIKGNEESFPSLKAEKWDFSSGSRDNMALYRSAIQNDNEYLINALVAAKAPVDIATPEPFGVLTFPICVANGKDDIKLVHQMLSYQKTIDKAALQSCLSAAAKSGDLALVNLWLARGANPLGPCLERPRDGSLGILIEGLSSGRAAIVRRLLQYHPDLRKPLDGYTILEEAMGSKAKDAEVDEILSLLVKAGAPINQQNPNGSTALHYAFLHPSSVRTLIALGASMDARDVEGDTPLMALASSFEAVKELLEAGADPTAVNKKGEDAVVKAHEMSCAPCVDALQVAITLHKKHVSH